MATKEGGMKKRNKSKSLKCGVYIMLLAKCTQKGLCQCDNYISIPLKISIIIIITPSAVIELSVKTSRLSMEVSRLSTY